MPFFDTDMPAYRDLTEGESRRALAILLVIFAGADAIYGVLQLFG